jgi:hypothetical protein
MDQTLVPGLYPSAHHVDEYGGLASNNNLVAKRDLDHGIVFPDSR